MSVWLRQGGKVRRSGRAGQRADWAELHNWPDSAGLAWSLPRWLAGYTPSTGSSTLGEAERSGSPNQRPPRNEGGGGGARCGPLTGGPRACDWPTGFVDRPTVIFRVRFV
jgi:hypothetical protein